jgi:polysaccharide export outer membrane protein
MHLQNSPQPGSNQSDCYQNERYVIYPGDIIRIFCVKKHEPVDKYKIRIGDRLQIKFISLSDYSSEQFVKPDGTIDMPRLPCFKVAGLSIDSVQADLQRQYSKLRWQPEFYITIAMFDNSSQDIQTLFMNANGQFPGSIVVRPDGFAGFPLIGALAVSGKVVDTVQNTIQERYAKLYPDLHFELTMDKMTGDRVFIYGQVGRPGGYTLSKNQSIYELFALGGVLTNASMRDIIAIRSVDGHVECSRIDCSHLKSPSKTSSNFQICPGTIVYVPASKLSTVGDIMKDISNIIFFKGFGVGMQWNFSDPLNNAFFGTE